MIPNEQSQLGEADVICYHQLSFIRLVPSGLTGLTRRSRYFLDTRYKIQDKDEDINCNCMEIFKNIDSLLSSVS